MKKKEKKRGKMTLTATTAKPTMRPQLIHERDTHARAKEKKKKKEKKAPRWLSRRTREEII